VGNARIWPILAWGVHLYTALGAVVGVWALLAIAQGAWRRAVLLMLVGLFIDSTDGMMARALDVPRLIPLFDGRRLDDMVDFLNYVIVPAVFLVATGLLPHPAWAAVPILASAYGFGQVEAKTDDDFFLGFPSYWNVLAIYAWLLGVSPAACTVWVLGLSALVFVPLKYIYPSKLRVLRRTTFFLAAACMACVASFVLAPETAHRLRLLELSLVFPVWYVGLSFALGGLHRKRT
jgi:phosphatidylcholine synthase